jgi:hypothetical protein
MRAVSSPKYNELMVTLKEVEGFWQEQLARTSPAEGFAWTRVELPNDWVELALSEHGQVGPFATGARSATLAGLAEATD